MIVKNENAVIKRCLESTLPLIDYWVIVDTGSTDGTQQIIREFLKDIPGELHERPWVNFGHNREEALQLAKNKADYILFMDADDKLAYGVEFQLPELTHDFYAIASQGRGIQCLLPRLIKANLDWHWYDVLHEFIMADEETHGTLLQNIVYVYIADGARNCDPKKYEKDIAVLEQAMKERPHYERYPFYLGQTYLIIGDYANALKAYKKRAQMGGFEEEIFVSKLQIARVMEKIQADPLEVEKAYVEAYRFRPIRLEPIFGLAAKAIQEGNYEKGFELAGLGLLLPQQDTLFVDQWIYDYGIYHQYAIAAFHLKKYWEALRASEKALEASHVPENERREIETLYKKIKAKEPRSIHQSILNLIAQ